FKNAADEHQCESQNIPFPFQLEKPVQLAQHRQHVSISPLSAPLTLYEKQKTHTAGAMCAHHPLWVHAAPFPRHALNHASFSSPLPAISRTPDESAASFMKFTFRRLEENRLYTVTLHRSQPPFEQNCDIFMTYSTTRANLLSTFRINGIRPIRYRDSARLPVVKPGHPD